MDEAEKTFWENRVLVEYDEVKQAKINTIRAEFATIIDGLNSLIPVEDTDNGETQRLFNKAMLEAEWDCMWAIKAVCKQILRKFGTNPLLIKKLIEI